MLSTIRKSAAAVAALGALGLGGAAIAGAVDNTRSSSGGNASQTRPARAQREALKHRGRGQGKGRRARQGARGDGAAHRVRRPVRDRPTTPTSGPRTARGRSCSSAPRSRPRRSRPTGAVALGAVRPPPPRWPRRGRDRAHGRHEGRGRGRGPRRVRRRDDRSHRDEQRRHGALRSAHQDQRRQGARGAGEQGLRGGRRARASRASVANVRGAAPGGAAPLLTTGLFRPQRVP